MPDRDDRIPLFVLTPRSEPPAGASTIQVDLGAFFTLLQRVGRDPALLLLTIRATRVRMSALYGVHELAWWLRARKGDVLAWLDLLSRERLVDYHVSAAFGRDAMLLEILNEPVIPPPPTDAEWESPSMRRIEHALPAFWFVTVLPRIGRKPFLVYLLLRRAETTDYAMVHPRAIAEMLQLSSPRHSLRHLAHLRRHGLVRRHRDGRTLIVIDPPPPTRAQRFLLRLGELGLWPRIVVEAALYVILIALLVTLVFVIHTL